MSWFHKEEDKAYDDEEPGKPRHPLSRKQRWIVALPIGPVIGSCLLTLLVCVALQKSPRWILKRLGQVYGLVRVEVPPEAKEAAIVEPIKPTEQIEPIGRGAINGIKAAPRPPAKRRSKTR